LHCLGINELCGKKLFLSSRQSLGYSKNSPSLMTPKASLRLLKEPDVYPLLNHKNPDNISLSHFFKTHFIIFTSCTLCLQEVFSLTPWINNIVYALTILTTSLYYIGYRVIQNDCRGFNNLSYTIHLRDQHIVAPMDQEILKVFFYDVRCAVVMHFSAWSAVY